MSNIVDNRIVNMQFNNTDFERGIHTSLKSIDQFNEALKFKGANHGLQELNASLAAFDLYSIEASIEALSNRFTAFGIIGMTAIQNITNKVIDLGSHIGTTLVNQIKSGGIARYKNIAQAKFQIEGLDADWKALYEDMDYAVSGTAYGIDEAAVVASSLVASGKEAGDGMKKALRAVSGVAAMTNSSYSEIGQIFTTVAGNGKVMAMQLNQLAYKGLNAAATLAKVKNTTEASIREMVSQGKISFDEFAEAMDYAFGEHAKDANKMFEGSLANLKSALSRIGENFARPIYEGLIEPLNALRLMFDAVKKAFIPFTGILTDGSWEKSPFGFFIKNLMNNITRLIESITSNKISKLNKWVSGLNKVFAVANQVLLKEGNPFDIIIDFLDKSMAFRPEDVEVYDALVDFLTALKNLSGVANNIFESINNLISVIVSVFREVFSLGDVSKPVVSISEALLNLSETMKFTEQDAEKIRPALVRFFTTIKDIYEKIAEYVPKIIDYIKPVFIQLGDIFMGLGDSFMDVVDNLIDFVENSEFLNKLWTSLTDIFGDAEGLFDKFKDGVSGVTDILKKVDLKKLALGWGLLFALSLVLKTMEVYNRFLSVSKNIVNTVAQTASIMRNIGWVTEGLSYMAKNIIYAVIIKEIASAIAMLAIAVAALTFVDQDKLWSSAKALTMLIVAMGVLAYSIAALAKLNQSFESVAFIWTLGSLFKSLAIAIGILVLSLVVLSKLDTETIWKNMEVLGTMFAALVLAAVAFSLFMPKLTSGAFALIGVAGAMMFLAVALKILEGIDVTNVADKLTYLLLAITGVVVLANFVNNITFGATAGIIGLIFTLIALELALQYIAKNGIDYNTLKENIDKYIIIFGAFILLAFVFKKLNTELTNVKMAVSVLILIATLIIIARTLQILGKMDSAKLQGAISAFVVIMLGLIGLLYSLNKFSDKEASYSGMANSILKLVLGLVVIALTLKILSTIGGEQLLYGVTALAAILFVLMWVVEKLSSIEKHISTTSILAVTLLMAVIGLILIGLAALPNTDDGISAAIAISIVLIVLAGSLTELSEKTSKMNAALISSLYSVIILLIAIAAALAVLIIVTKDPTTLLISVSALVIVLYTVVEMIIKLTKEAGKTKLGVFDLILSCILLLGGIAASLTLLSRIGNVENLAGSALAIVFVLFSVTLVITKLSGLSSKMNVAAMGNIAIAVLMLIAIAYSLKILLDGEYDFKDMLKTAGILVGVLMAVVLAVSLLTVVSAAVGTVPLFVAAAAIAKVLLLLSVTMIAFAISIKAITNGLKKLTEIDYDAIDVGKLLKLGGALVVLGIGSIAAGVGILLLSVALIGLGIAISIISLAFVAVVTSIVSFIESINKLIAALLILTKNSGKVKTAIRQIVSTVANSIIVIATAIAKGIITFLMVLNTNLPVIIKTIANILAAIVLLIFETITKINKALIVGLINLFTMLDEYMPVLLTKFGSVMVKFINFLVQYAPYFGMTAAYITVMFLYGAINALINTAPLLINEVVLLATALISGFADALVDNGGLVNNAIRSLINSLVYTIMNVLDAIFSGSLSKLDAYQGIMDGLVEEQEQLAIEREQMRADLEDNAYISEKEKNASKIEDTNNKLAKTTTDQKDIYDKSAKSNADSYTDSFGNYIQNGKDKIHSALSGAMPESDEFDFSNVIGIGQKTDEAIANDIADNSNIIKVKLNDIPEEYLKNYKSEDGWNLDETGQYMIKTLNTGIENEATADNAQASMNDMFSFFGVNGDFSQFMGEGATDSAGMWNSGLLGTLSDPNAMNDIYNTTFNQGEQAMAGWDDATKTESPSKEAIKRGGFWISGLVMALTAGNKELEEASEANAETVMDVYSDTISRVSSMLVAKESNDIFTPTIKPVIDSSNIDQYSSSLPDMFFNPASINLATNSTLSLQNTTESQLANQVAALQASVDKLANQDFEHMMDGVQINVNNNTTLDGKQIGKHASSYTIADINRKEEAMMMAMGGSY